MTISVGYGPAAPNVSSRDHNSLSALTAAEVIASRRQFADIRCGRSLADMIESEIIPRLIGAHPVADPMVSAALTADDIAAFAPLALQVEAGVLLEHAEAMLARGVSVESMLVDVLAPAARELGEYWEADRCDFVDVTMGLWRLQEVVYEVVAQGSFERRGGTAPKAALFSGMPGDQHGFGALVVEEVFAMAGWATGRIGEPNLPEMYGRVGGEWFDLVGLTVSCDYNTGALPAVITALRSVSRNPRLVIMVGGPVFARDPALAEVVGADGTAGDARAAVAVATTLVEAIEREGMSCG